MLNLLVLMALASVTAAQFAGSGYSAAIYNPYASGYGGPSGYGGYGSSGYGGSGSSGSGGSGSSGYGASASAELPKGVICGGFFIAGMGKSVISSPNFPNQYPRSQDCIYKITAGRGKKIQITFTAMDVEYNTRCAWDYIKISSGGNVIKKICGSKKATITVKSDKATVLFHSDSSIQKRGFKATLTAV